MFVIPALAALFTFVFLRPHEVFEPLTGLTINMLMAAIALAYVLDARLGFARPRGSRLLVLIGGMFCLAVVSIVIRAPATLGEQILLLATSLIVFVAISEGVQTFRALSVVAGILVALTIALAFMGVYQGVQPKICYIRGSDFSGSTTGETIDGRPCEVTDDCEQGGVVKGAEYLCEHPGLFGTHSIGGRVRFRGLLEDPNELCLVLAMGAPLAFGLYERRRSKARLAFALATFALVTVCVIMTRSRSGQMAILAAVGVFFVRRFGKRGLAVAALMSVPLLILGGRAGEEAESSSVQRLECWAEALEMWRDNPLLGVGQGQFIEHHFLTAHNSFLLTLAEMGPLGLLVYTATLYFALKITFRAQVELDRPEAAVARSWGASLMASLVGLSVGSFFLSVPFNTILWLFLALAGSFYAAVQNHEPGWRVRFGLRDLAAVVFLDVSMVIGLMFYIRLKGV
jgi:hypothetical protein